MTYLMGKVFVSLRIVRALTYFGRNTFGIYIIHILLLPVMLWLGISGWAGMMSAIIISLVASCLIITIVKKNFVINALLLADSKSVNKLYRFKLSRS
jgi:fucose 4-O-acetylase-like acetyltransferase